MKKIVALIILLATICFLFTGCGSGNDFVGEMQDYYDIAMNNCIERGFSVARSRPLFATAPEAEPFFCAYRSDKRVFDINDVTIDFYYGCEYQTVDVMLMDYSFSDFKIVIVNRDNEKNNGYIYERQVGENLVSEKYKCTSTTNITTHVTEYEFNFSETIKLPRELFDKDSGYISIRIVGSNQARPDEGEGVITGTGFYYVLVDGKVILSNNELRLYNIIK